MSTASAMKLASSSSVTASASRRPLKSAAVSVVPSVPRSRSVAKPQALFIKTYGPSSCRPSRYYRSPPSLGLGLARTLGMVDQFLTSEWLRETTSAVHPMEIRTLEDRYELQSDCPGMGEEDITVEVSPDRVLTIAGSRRSRRAPSRGRDEREEDRNQQPAASEAAAIVGPEAPEKPSGPVPAAAEGKAAHRAAADKAGSNDDGAAWGVAYRFKRSFVLPEDADVESVTASVDRWVVRVCVPRRAVEAPQPRRVAVSGGGAK